MAAASSPASKKQADRFAEYENDWDPGDLDAVLAPVAEPLPAYTTSSPADLLRRAIAADPARHGAWFHLRQYRPMPKRTALAMAASWRRVSPARFGGDRNFQARILPADETGRARPDLAVTKGTLYAVAILYPSSPQEPVPAADPQK